MNFERWRDDLEARWQSFKGDVEEIFSLANPVVRIDDAAVGKVFAGGGDWDNPHLRCPVCGFSCTHVRSASARTGTDKREGGKGFRGVETRGLTDDRRDALCIGVTGECGHNFNIVFQQHKGTEFIQIEIAEKDEKEMLQQQAANESEAKTVWTAHVMGHLDGSFTVENGEIRIAASDFAGVCDALNEWHKEIPSAKRSTRKI